MSPEQYEALHELHVAYQRAERAFRHALVELSESEQRDYVRMRNERILDHVTEAKKA